MGQQILAIFRGEPDLQGRPGHIQVCSETFWTSNILLDPFQAVRELDIAHSHYYLITPADLTLITGTPDFILGGSFVMKAGSQSSEDITIELFEAALPLPTITGSDTVITPVGAALATRTFSHTEFCAQVTGNCQSFDTHTFDFLEPYVMDPLKNYFVKLSSPLPADQQSQAYFIKEPNPFVLTFTDEPQPVPEPSAFGLAGLGLLAAARFARRR